MRVTRVGRSLLKGTRHETFPEARLDLAGVQGDRELCLLDLDRDRVLRTVDVPELVAVRAGWGGDELVVRIPGDEVVCASLVPGETATVDFWGRPAAITRQSSPHAALLSAYLRRPVALAQAQRGHLVYRDGVSLITTGALERLSATCGVRTTELAARFRANFTLEADHDPAVGARIRLGEALVHVTQPIDRCAVVDVDAAGRRTPGVLSALPLVAGAPTFGMAARVIRPGRVVTED